MNSEVIIVRLLINCKTGRIAYARAGRDFVDLLYSFLDLPTGSIPKLLSAGESAMELDCISNLQESVKRIPSQFMTTDKSRLLDPKFITTYVKILRIEGGNYYVCPSFSNDIKYITHEFSYSSGKRCRCGEPMNCLVQMEQNTIVNPASGSSSSHETEKLHYIITDDLEIMPNSPSAATVLLEKLNVKDESDLEECIATVDRNKALELLKASLVSTTVLNDVFCFEKMDNFDGDFGLVTLFGAL